MRNFLFALILLTTLILSSCQANSTSAPAYDDVLNPDTGLGLWGPIDLSPAEKEWLATHDTVDVHVGALPPYMIPGANPQGMAIDYVSLILQRHGLEAVYFSPPEVTRVDAWAQVTDKNGVDLMPTMSQTPERDCCFVFSRGYLFLPWVIVTRDDGDFVGSIEDLYGKTVVLPADLDIIEILKKDYPQINIKTVEGYDVFEQIVTILATGQADATIADLGVITYRIQHDGALNLKIAAQAPFERPENGMGIRNDWPELAGIVTKSLDAMTPQQHTAIRNRWLSVRYEYGLRVADIVKWVLLVSALAVVIVAVIMGWNRRLAKEINQRKKAEAEAKAYSLLLEQTVDERTAALNDLEQAQTQVIEQQRVLATLEERERLGRDLHDGLGQAMGYLNVQAQAVEAQLNDGLIETAQRNLSDLSAAAQEAHQTIRSHILGLRVSETPNSDFLTTVREYVGQLGKRYNLTISLDIPADFPNAPFNPAVEEQVVRILQEALTNVRRHAQTEAIAVQFSQTDHDVVLRVIDYGIGFSLDDETAAPSQANGHFGLQIMRERATQVGGNLTIETAPGQGVRLTVRFPVDTTNPAHAIGDNPAQNIRLLLVDDHPLFLQGLRNLLLARGFTVIGLARSGPEGVEKTRQLRPDVVVMDLNMPDGGGLAATQAIKAEFPDTQVVILTVAEEDNLLFEAIQSGASGYLLKSLDANEFCNLLTGLLRGEAPLQPQLTKQLMTEFARVTSEPLPEPAEEDVLSAQQWEIMGYVAAGLTYKEIADQVHLSSRTVQYHVSQIVKKLNLKTRAEAIAWFLAQQGPS